MGTKILQQSLHDHIHLLRETLSITIPCSRTPNYLVTYCLHRRFDHGVLFVLLEDEYAKEIFIANYVTKNES